MPLIGRLTYRRDVWADLKPNDPGLTYDGRTNAMLGPGNNIRCLLQSQTKAVACGLTCTCDAVLLPQIHLLMPQLTRACYVIKAALASAICKLTLAVQPSNWDADTHRIAVCRGRVDRCLVRMVDWAPSEVELVGLQPLGPQWQKTLRRGVVQMETLPSDHYGIFSSFRPVVAA